MISAYSDTHTAPPLMKNIQDPRLNENYPGQSCLRSSTLYFHLCCPSGAMSLSLHKRASINLQSTESWGTRKPVSGRLGPSHSVVDHAEQREQKQLSLASHRTHTQWHTSNHRASRLCLHSLGSCSRPRNWIDGISQATESLCWAESPVAVYHVF